MPRPYLHTRHTTTTPKFDLVRGKHTRFVAEHVFDLSELFDEGGGTAEGGGAHARVIHVEIEIYYLRLLGFTTSMLTIGDIVMRLWWKDDDREYV